MLALVFLGIGREDALEAFVDDDLCVLLAYAAEAGIGLETSKAWVGHGRRVTGAVCVEESRERK